MSEYIDKAEALSRFSFYNGDRIPEKDVDGFPNTITFHDAKMVIRSIRPADVRAVVRGHWDKDERCSVCGEFATEGLDAEKWNYWFPDFCPHCGADMREEEK